MSELRQDPTTREWVIMAPERAGRPQQASREKLAEEVPDWDESCPFCPGNEGKTPPETLRFPSSSQPSSWEVRVVPNRFAALSFGAEAVEEDKGPFFRKRAGTGVHEVIIESPAHNTSLALMPYEHVEKVLKACRQRYNALKQDKRLKFITIFKNHGRASGTSLVHPHSQLVATPISAPYYHRRLDIAVDYYADTGRCLYCDLLAREMERGERVVAETGGLAVIHPYASRVPWETWIIPKEHHASFGLYPEEHLAELAMVLKDTLFCLYRGLGNPAFNFMIDTSVTDDEENPYYHGHIRIVPRLTLIAGFEMGSGIYINAALPEVTAGLMREVARSLPDSECPALKPKV